MATFTANGNVRVYIGHEFCRINKSAANVVTHIAIILGRDMRIHIRTLRLGQSASRNIIPIMTIHAVIVHIDIIVIVAGCKGGEVRCPMTHIAIRCGRYMILNFADTYPAVMTQCAVVCINTGVVKDRSREGVRCLMTDMAILSCRDVINRFTRGDVVIVARYAIRGDRNSGYHMIKKASGKGTGGVTNTIPTSS